MATTTVSTPSSPPVAGSRYGAIFRPFPVDGRIVYTAPMSDRPSVPPSSEALWGAFCESERTLGPRVGVRDEWRAGRARYCVWALRVDDPAIRQRVADVAAALGDWIRPVPLGQLHVTLFVAGFPCVLPRADDDVPRRLLLAQARALGERVRGSGPVRLTVGAANSFATAAFLEVQDTRGALSEQRCVLAAEFSTCGRREIRFAPYVPHVTVGTYDADHPVVPIADALRDFRSLSALPLEVRNVELVDFDASLEHAPLRTLLSVSLVTGEVVVAEA